MYQRRLRELSDRYSRDVGKLKDRYEENLKEIDKQRAENIDEIRESAEQKLVDQKKDQMREVGRIADRFERQSIEDSKTYYDKYGKALDANSREIKHLKSAYADQIDDLIKAQDKLVTNLKKGQEEELFKVRRQSEQNRFKTGDETQAKLDAMAEAFAKQSRSSTKEYNDALNAERRRHFEEARLLKNTSDLRLNQQENQAKNVEAKMRDAFQSREKQLIDEKNLTESKIEARGDTSLRNYRERLSDSLAKVQSENNFENTRKDIKQANALSKLEHEHKLKEQDLKSNLGIAAAAKEESLRSERDRMALNNEIARRRMTHDSNLSQEAAKKRYEDTISELKAQHSENLQKMKMDQQEDFTTLKRNFIGKMNQMERNKQMEDEMRAMQNQDSYRDTTAKHLSEKNRIINAYEQRQKALENNFERMSEDQKKYYSAERQREYREREAMIARANQENVDKMYQQRVRLEGINKNQMTEYSQNVASLKDNQQLMLRNTELRHAATLEDLEKIYSAQFDELKRESANQIAKLRADADASKKEMAFDYEYRIKNMAQDYESKINEMTMKSERELNALKQDHERAMRQAQARHRDELEGIQESHKKALALIESQYKDKIKVQEDNHKSDLARMRHTMELYKSRS